LHGSGLGVGTFCRREAISAASLYRRRSLLGEAGDEIEAVVSDTTPAFVDLGSLNPPASSAMPATIRRFWRYVVPRVYLQARERNPARWSDSARNWMPIGAVTLNPERDPIIKTHLAGNPVQLLAA
jgi:hypothetical protein